MPKLNELYTKYKDQGVEFIGVSLEQYDQLDLGLARFKKFLKDKEISWPQYFQMDGWESEFSTSWGISSVPSTFVINAEGNLHSTEPHGKLDEMIAELIKKRDG